MRQVAAEAKVDRDALAAAAKKNKIGWDKELAAARQTGADKVQAETEREQLMHRQHPAKRKKIGDLLGNAKLKKRREPDSDDDTQSDNDEDVDKDEAEGSTSDDSELEEETEQQGRQKKHMFNQATFRGAPTPDATAAARAKSKTDARISEAHLRGRRSEEHTSELQSH